MATEIDVSIDPARVRPYKGKEGSKLKAFCNVTIGPVTINNCRIVDGMHGPFVGFPEGEVYTDKNGDEKRQRYIWIEDKAVMDACNEEAERALEALGDHGTEAPSDDIPF